MALTATMRLVDEVSNKFNNMATSGAAAMQKINGDLAAANAMFVEYDVAAVKAGKATLEWTDKLGNYDQEAMMATHTTEELIEQGYAVAVAIDDAGDAAEEAGEAIDELGEQASKTGEDFEESGEKSEEFGDKSKQAIGDLDQLLATAGIAAALKEIYEGFKEAAEAAEKLETAQAQLATIAGESNLPMLTPQIDALSNASGIAATELNDVAYNAISAGSAVEDSVNMAKTATELATAGFTNSGAALSVLSTAMNSYGDQIESVTDVADSLITVQNLGVTTVDQLAAQMGKSIATAAAYGVSLGNVESAYISVTKAGINTAEGTTYISGMLNELGKSSSDIAKIIQEETGKSFGQLMNDGYSLADVLGIVYGKVNQNSEAMINLFGSQEAGKAAMAIINQGLDQFNENLNAVQNSTGATASAYAIMANTTEHAHERMNNAALNTKAIIGDQLNASLKGLYNTGATIIEGVGKFLQKAPAVTAILTGVTIGLGALTVGVAAYSAVTKYGAIVQAAFNAAMAANPLFWIVPIIVGVVAATAVLVNVMKEATAEYDALSASSKKQYNELERLRGQYEQVAAAEGEASDEAARLAAEIEVQEAVFEKTKMTTEEWNNRVNDYVTSSEDLRSSVNDLLISQEAGATTIDNLLGKYSELTGKEELNAAEKTELQAVVGVLNDKVTDLGLTFDEVSGKTNKSADEIKALYQAASHTEYLDAAQKKLGELADKIGEGEVQKTIAENQVAAAQEALDAAEQAMNDYSASAGSYNPFQYWTSTKDERKALKEAQENLDAINSELEENQTQYDSLTDSINENTTAIDTGNEIANEAINSQASALQTLAAAYDEAYAKAEESFSGQFGLFDQAKADTEATVANAQAALDSQLSYWTTYADNVSQLKNVSAEDLGVTQETYDSLMAYAQSGTEQAAGLAQSMVDSINSGNTEAVSKLAETYAAVEEQQKTAASQVADWQTDFSNKLQQIQNDMNKTVDEMDKASEAQAAGTETVNAYISAIRAKVSEAYNASAAVAAAASSGFNSGGGTGGTPGHAAGSTNTEDAFIAGEQGPELYVGYGGGTVFPHSETEQVINAVKDYADFPEPPEEVSSMSVQPASASSGGGESSEKQITLTINGGGSIKMDGAVDKEQVLEIMMGNLRPVLLDLLEEEISEEGDGTYEY
ncbi:MAG: phage tail tape measure protein [Eubacterium sp.]|nr:phage tail tape measure protein [Eubacterium sp.]